MTREAKSPWPWCIFHLESEHSLGWKGFLEVSSPISWSGCSEPFPAKIWKPASMEIPESFWVTCLSLPTHWETSEFVTSDSVPCCMSWLLVLALGLCVSEDSQALGHWSIQFIWLYLSNIIHLFLPFPPLSVAAFALSTAYIYFTPQHSYFYSGFTHPSSLAGEMLSLPGFTQHFPNHIYRLHSPLCHPVANYQYNLTANKDSYSSRAKKNPKWNANFHLWPKSHNCVISFPRIPYPALPFLPLWLTPHSQQDDKLFVRRATSSSSYVIY